MIGLTIFNIIINMQKAFPHCHRAAYIKMALSKKTNDNLSVARVNGQKKKEL